MTGDDLTSREAGVKLTSAKLAARVPRDLVPRTLTTDAPAGSVHASTRTSSTKRIHSYPY